MSKAKLISARELIKNKKYTEARLILEGIEHPTAREWLNKLNEIDPQPKKGKVPRSRRLLLFVGTGLGIVSILFLAVFLISPRNSSAQIAELPTLIVLPSVTPSFTLSPTKTFTPKPTDTPSVTSTPLPTDTPSITPSPTNTATPRPTSTPVYESFRHPAPIGHTMVRTSLLGQEMNATVLEVVRGSAAYALAETELYSADEPIASQEYLAIRIRYAVTEADPYIPFNTFISLHFSLRYEESGTNVIPEVTQTDYIEGYPPLERQYWLIFLIRANSSPVLYFQPQLLAEEVFGYRNTGAYFAIQ